MSLTSVVPAAVPSLFHNSAPCDLSKAVKKSVPFISIKLEGYEPAGPGLMSLTSTVPAAVPLEAHSSLPLTPLLAPKNTLPSKETKSPGLLEADPGLMSFKTCGIRDGRSLSSKRSNSRRLAWCLGDFPDPSPIHHRLIGRMRMCRSPGCKSGLLLMAKALSRASYALSARCSSARWQIPRAALLFP